VRVLGAIGVVQLDHRSTSRRPPAAAVDAGVWLRPFRDLVYTMPPVRLHAPDDLADDHGAVCAAARRPRQGESRDPARWSPVIRHGESSAGSGTVESRDPAR
jgi:hypothetical protein